MLFWAQTLLAGLVTLVASFLYSHLLHHSSSPMATTEKTGARGLISPETLAWIQDIRDKYDLPGIGIGIIGSPAYTGSGWKNETHSWGVMDHTGRPVHDKVSFRSFARAVRR